MPEVHFVNPPVCNVPETRFEVRLGQQDYNMVGRKHLKKAPITEAIVDIRVKARPDLDVAIFSEPREMLAAGFPTKVEQRVFTTKVQFGPKSGSQSTEHDLRGYMFRSEDEFNVVQFRVDGFTFNRLKPYTSWKSVWPQALELWRKYQKMALPVAITRMALRYINHIALPARAFRLEDVLTCPPPVPKDLGATIARFTTRVTIQASSRRLEAHIAQAVEPKPDHDGATLILDIDAFRQAEVLLEEDDVEARIEETFAELHEFKNEIFFASLSETTIEGFE